MPPTTSLIDIIFIAVAVEFAVLALALWATARDEWIAPLGAFLASGAALMLAVRLTLAGSGDSLIQAALAAAGLLHLITLLFAWRAARG